MSGTSPQTNFEHSKSYFPGYLTSAINSEWVKQKFDNILTQQHLNYIANNLNPFNLCPVTIAFWYPITQNTRLGVTTSSLERIRISIRQRLVPNDLIHLTIRIIQLGTPFPLTLLTMFSSLGLWINGAVDKLMTNATEELIIEQDELLNNLEEDIDLLFSGIVTDNPLELPPDLLKKVREALIEQNRIRIREAVNPFNLSPTMTIYFPILKTHTAIGIGFMDLQRLSISIRQFVDPHDIIFTTIRIIELKVPFPLSIFSLFLSVGLFLNGSINKLEQATCNGIFNEVKQLFQHYRKR